jgi:hypothetical protein
MKHRMEWTTGSERRPVGNRDRGGATGSMILGVGNGAYKAA